MASIRFNKSSHSEPFVEQNGPVFLFLTLQKATSTPAGLSDVHAATKTLFLRWRDIQLACPWLWAHVGTCIQPRCVSVWEIAIQRCDKPHSKTQPSACVRRLLGRITSKHDDQPVVPVTPWGGFFICLLSIYYLEGWNIVSDSFSFMCCSLGQ